MGKTVVITGANKGLGLEMVRQFAARGDRLFALCRSTSDELAAVPGDVNVVAGVDVKSDDVGNVLLKSPLAGERIDVLINNAGGYGGPPPGDGGVMAVFAAQALDKITTDIMRDAFELNTLGPLRVVQALLAQMSDEGSKVIIISSLMGSIADNTSGGSYGYRTAKAAVNMVAKSLSCDLKSKGVAVGMVHPGMVATSFAGDHDKVPEGMRKNMHPPEVAAQGVIEAIDATTLETTGKFWHGNYGKGIKECPW